MTNNRIVKITFCKPGQLRFRTVVTRSRERPTFEFPSIKAKRMVQAEGCEVDVFRELECDPHIRTYSEQPCEIVYLDGSEEKRHIPDTLVEPFTGDNELWEVKPLAEAITEDIIIRTAILSCDLPYYGYRYRLKIAEEAAQQPGLKNRITILTFGYRPFTDYEREFIRRICEASGSVGWGEASSGAYGPYGREILCRLFLEGALTCDMNEPLSPAARFFARHGVM